VDDSNSSLIGEYGALIGEFAWHSLTVDPSLDQVSEAHYRYVVSALEDYGRRSRAQGMKVLEVACYAHTTGYRLQQELGCEVTLFDISAKALQLGRRMAESAGIRARPQLVAGDFHALPFEADSFDVVYIASAIHHTWKYGVVISELQRVLAPGGLLMLLNEPCHRLCCFYGFRTSRPASFSQFENVLNNLGIIRTFAEPYLGSRPETLFGMIENQKIPLRGLLDLLNSGTKIIKLKLTPEDCMGDLEKFWLDSRSKGTDLLSGIIESTLMDRRAEAMKHFDEVAEGMQLHLPSPDQLQPFAKRVAQALCNLPPVSDQEAFRTALSEIFGAAVQIVAEKPHRQFDRPDHTLNDRFETKDDVIYTFDDRIRKILLHDSSLLPDIQVASEDEIANIFPADYWQYTARNAEGGRPIITLGLKSQPGRFQIPGCGHNLLLVLRYFCIVPEHGDVRVRIQHLDRQLYLQRIWQSESLLCVALLPPTNDIIVLDLFREILAPNGERELSPEGLAIAFIGAFQIE
jgi:ubiquinone/menaquinone biosynthesis C-methylase UbiE